MAQFNKESYGYDQPGQPPSYQPASMPYGAHGDAVMAQPMPVSTSTVIVQQPTPTVMIQGPRTWSSGICACCEDMTICLCVAFCPVCYECHLASKMGESCCVPCSVPGSLIALRAYFRGKHNISGSIMDDCCMVACCYPCTVCQLSREVDRMNNTTVIVQGGSTTTTTVANVI